MMSQDTAAGKRRGRISHTVWPTILAEYDSGETLTGLARSYGCTPSNIAYIVRRAREKIEAGELGPATTGGDVVATQSIETAASPQSVKPVETTPVAPAQNGAPRRRLTMKQFTDTPTMTSSQPAATQQQPYSQPIAQSGRKASPNETESIKGCPETHQRLIEHMNILACTYSDWCQNNGLDSDALHEALHESRKVLARIEIELATSKRDGCKHAPIPVPTHRFNRR